MITSFSIENYRSIANIEIELSPTITVITGKSDSGKSAFIRALRDTFYHTTGADHVTHEAPHSKTILRFESNEMIWWKGKKRNEYELNRRKWPSPGRSAPTQVQEALRVFPLELSYSTVYPHIQQQSDIPFIIAHLPSENAEILAKVSGLSQLQGSIKKVNRDIRDVNSRKNQVGIEISVDEEALSRTVCFDEIDLDQVKSLAGTLHDLVGIYEKLQLYGILQTVSMAEVQEVEQNLQELATLLKWYDLIAIKVDNELQLYVANIKEAQVTEKLDKLQDEFSLMCSGLGVCPLCLSEVDDLEPVLEGLWNL